MFSRQGRGERAGGQTGAAGSGKSTRREEDRRGPSGGKENFICTKGPVSGMSVAFWQEAHRQKILSFALTSSLPGELLCISEGPQGSFILWDSGDDSRPQDKEPRQW